MTDETLMREVRQARGKFVSMATTYGLGVFNDSFFRQSAMLLAVGAVAAGADRSSMQGWILAIFALPYLLFAAPAGWLADRFSKRRVVIGAKALELAAMGIGAVGIITGSWPLILTMAFTMALQSCVFGPSLNGSIPELYPAEYVVRANARLKAVVMGMIITGIAVASVAMHFKRPVFGELPLGRLAVAVGVVVVALVGLAISFGVPKRPAANPRAAFPWTGPRDTLRQFGRLRRDRLLWTVIWADVFVWFVGALLFPLINFMAKRQFGWGDLGAGLLGATQAVGVAAGGLLAGRVAGPRWHRVIPLGAGGLGLGLMLVGTLPLLGAVALPVGVVLMLLTGMAGGLFLVPCEAFIQVRPASEHRGTVLASSNFAVFAGILISGPLSNVLNKALPPSLSLMLLGAVAMPVALLLWLKLPERGTFINDALMAIGRALLWLRYRVGIRGVEAVAERGRQGILFLPSHPALIDPVILVSRLYGPFRVRALGDEHQIDRFFIRRMARWINVLPIPDMTRADAASPERVREVIDACVTALAAGDNVMLYPAGQILRGRYEEVGGNSAVETILRRLPEVRVVLVRTRGLWGSSFSWASGGPPSVGGALSRGIRALLAGGVFFATRRRVDIELLEPDDLPREADRATINGYIGDLLNDAAPPNTYVPYTPWERGGGRIASEPPAAGIEGDPTTVPAATRRIVADHLVDVSGVTRFGDGDSLGADLGLDSLAAAELITWLAGEFGFHTGSVDALRTVGDVMLAACGQAVAAAPVAITPPPEMWLTRRVEPALAAGALDMTIPEAFLAAAARDPGAVLLADQTSGVLTCRRVVLGVSLLRGEIAQLPGDRVGIMMPAAAAANVMYLATLLAGKTPVMVNWTLGPGVLAHCLESVGAKRILTARKLVSRAETQGVDFSNIRERFVFVEDLAAGLGFWRKLRAAVMVRLSWRSLRKACRNVPPTAAILFTSGSENLPKAVPLTHRNIITNVADVIECFSFTRADTFLGILPPFHSFGLTSSMALPLMLGLSVVYYPNPVDGAALGRVIDAYRGTILVGTPTFLHGIVRSSTSEQLASLRLVVSGAEKCTPRVYEAVARRCPNTLILEGYGVTECSPVISVNREHEARAGTIGRVLPSVEWALVHPETGEPAPPGAAGVLLVRGPSVFAGYLDYDVPSPFVDHDGKQWYRTGDLITVDAAGVLTFAGRLKRFIKLGGEMISLPAVEAVLDAAFRGAGDEGPILAVVATPGDENPEIVLFAVADVDREAANAAIRAGGLSGLHNIRRVIGVEELPLLGTGKTDYRALVDRLAE